MYSLIWKLFVIHYSFFTKNGKTVGTLPRIFKNNQTDMFMSLFGDIDLNLPTLSQRAIKKLPKAITQVSLK